MPDPTTENSTPAAENSNPDPKPVSISASGDVEGESSSTPAAEPTQSHDPIPTGNDSSGPSADAPQIISSPALPDITPLSNQTPEATPSVPTQAPDASNTAVDHDAPTERYTPPAASFSPAPPSPEQPAAVPPQANPTTEVQPSTPAAKSGGIGGFIKGLLGRN